MKILVLGWYYSSNLGDAVICDCTAQLLRSHLPQAQIEIRDMAGRTGFPARRPVDLKNPARLRFRRNLRFLAAKIGWDKQFSHEMWCLNQDLPRMKSVTEGQWDLAVFAGGQLFMDDLGLYVAHLTRELDRRKIPVIFNACGTGPSCSPALREKLAQALTLPSVRLVSCRDGADVVSSWQGKPPAVPTSDPALWTDAVYGIEKSASGTVGLGVLYPQSLSPKKTAAFWRSLTGELDRRQIPWKFFTNGSEWDMAFARTLLDGRPEEAYLCPAPENPRELVSLIASFRSIVGFRLHSHIIAASLGIPSVALIWDRKLPLFFEKLGLKNRCYTIRDSASSVLSALEEAEAADPCTQAVTDCRRQARDLLTGTVDAL